MPLATTNGVSLYYEEAGDGFPIVFSHEFAGDFRSWESQVRFFSRSYRCVAYCHRGFPPSSVPERLQDYSQDIIIEDLRGLVRELGIGQAHFVGCSMGAQTVLMFATRYPELCKSIVVAGAGSGSGERDQWLKDIESVVTTLRTKGIDEFAESYAHGPSRLRFKEKDPRGWAEFRRQLAGHSPVGQALMMQGVQRDRLSVLQLGAELRGLRVPTLLMTGDEDAACIEPNIFMKRHIRPAGLVMFPRTGHAINIEEPDLFNQAVERFLHAVERGMPWISD